MNITIKTATEERRAVMADYGITPSSTGWTINDMHTNTICVSDNAHTRRQARAMWLKTFEEFIPELRTTDKAIMEAEASFLAA